MCLSGDKWNADTETQNSIIYTTSRNCDLIWFNGFEAFRQVMYIGKETHWGSVISILDNLITIHKNSASSLFTFQDHMSTVACA